MSAKIPKWRKLITAHCSLVLVSAINLKKIKDIQDVMHIQLWFRDSKTLEGAKKRYPVAVSKAA